MKKINFYFIAFCLVIGMSIGTSFYLSANPNDTIGEEECGACEENPYYPGLSYCNFSIGTGGCDSNTGTRCNPNSGCI